MRAKYLNYNKGREPREISDVLGVLIERVSTKIDVRQGELVERWKEIAPSDWREVSRPIGVKKQILLVEVDNGTVGSLLKHQENQLIGAIIDVFGKDLVTSVKLRVKNSK